MKGSTVRAVGAGRGCLDIFSLIVYAHGRRLCSNYAPAYSKNSGKALSVTPVRPVRPSVCPSVRPTFVSGP